MDPETEPLKEQQSPAEEEIPAQLVNEDRDSLKLIPVQSQDQGIGWMFLGPHGLRAGWAVTIWLILMLLLMAGLGFVLSDLHLLDRKAGTTPKNMFFNELVSVLALLGSVAVMALIERRSILSYNLTGAKRPQHFLSGLVIGFASLSALIGSLAAGGWLHVGAAELGGWAIFKFGLFWAVVFLLVGIFEEGAFRCYLQATLARGINFWWALGVVALICGLLAARHAGNGVRGDYGLALLGLIPCYILHSRRAPNSGFWQAAWATSTFFGFVHTGNGGESWIGIFAAGAIGFVFCVSVWLTGSAWWAIGAHAGWDWGETYFYGTPDSGMVATGHYLSTTLSGNPLWSGGETGPEGSLLVLAVIFLMLIWLIAVYGRGHREERIAPRVQETVSS